MLRLVRVLRLRAQELCGSRGVVVLGSPVPHKPTVSVDVKQHFNQRSEAAGAEASQVQYPVVHPRD